ncbi:MAG TPA: ComEC/Rec2 family competence protein [Candidatus Paceibacterota bacterium]
MLYIFTIGICVGIASGLLMHVGVMMYVALLVVSVSCIAFSRPSPRSLVVAFACAAVLIGIVRTEFFSQHIARENVLQFAHKKVLLSGVVIGDPDQRDTSTRITIDARAIDGGEAHGAVLASVGSDDALRFGDRVEVRGVIEAPESFNADAGREFDYPHYLRVHGVAAVMNNASVISSARGPWSVRAGLFDLKHTFESSLDRVFVDPDTSLVKGMLLGARRGIPQDIEETLVGAGLIHIVILAGYALSVVSRSVLQGVAFLPKRTRLITAALILVSYVAMTGAASTTVRASIMALIAMLARFLERPSVALRALAAAFVGIVLWNPVALLWDESLIISALATFGLVTTGAWFSERLSRVPERYGLREIASSTSAVQVFALPAILYYTGNLSLWSLPANMLALPALPLAMGFGFLSGVLGFLHPLIGLPAALITHLLIEWILAIASLATALPFGGATIGAFSPWIAVLAYIPLVWFAVAVYRDKAIKESRT